MNKKIKAGLLAVLLTTGIGIGVGLGQVYKYIGQNQKEQKPVINASENTVIIDANTAVIYEQEYLKCQHTVISEFPERDQLVGKTLKQLGDNYNTAKGYQVSWSNDTLVIHQTVNDWCERDKKKLRLKEYQGQVAIFQGPDKTNDVLLKVTRISIASLPPDIAKSIKEGLLEFDSQESLNDALENLDEYL